MEQALQWVIEIVAVAIEAVGVAVIVLGCVAALLRYSRHRAAPDAYRLLRTGLGRAILVGLEFMVAADIVGTVSVEPTYDNLGVLAAIVAIRTFLSLSLEVEINGRWPWQRDERSTGM